MATLRDLLTDPDRNLYKIVIPDDLRGGIEPTTFYIDRVPWTELMDMDERIREARRSDRLDEFYDQTFTNDKNWTDFQNRFIKVKSGLETMKASEVDLGAIPEHWRRYLSRQTAAERNEGFENRGELGEVSEAS